MTKLPAASGSMCSRAPGNASLSAEVGFAAVVGCDEVQPTWRNNQFVDRTVIGYRESLEHVSSWNEGDRNPLSDTRRRLAQVFSTTGTANFSF
jgi:hypothetical protein